VSTFADELDVVGAPLFVLRAMPRGSIKGRYAAPNNWQRASADGNPDLGALSARDGLAMRCGVAYDVLDVDPRNGGSLAAMHGQLPEVHQVVTTPGGGWHLYVSPMGVSGRLPWPGVDMQSDGRFVIVPPTDGYRVLDRTDWPDLGPADPYAVVRLRARAEGPSLGPENGEVGPVTEREREKAQAVLLKAVREVEAAEGARNTTVSRWLLPLYNFVRAEALDRCEVEDALWSAAERAPGNHPYTRREFEASCDSAWRKARPERPGVDTPEQDFATAAAGTDPPVADAGGWVPVALGDYFDGSRRTPEAHLLRRTDGVALLYPGMTHSIHGESESGKSMIVQAEVAVQLRLGNRVLYLDYEADPASVAERLRLMGVRSQELKRLAYVQPEVDYGFSEASGQAFAGLIGQPYALAVIDGVTEALAQAPAKVRSTGGLGGNDDITVWHDRLPRLIARRTGAAVVLVDHVAKSSEAGRFAIGGQAKMATISGAAYLVKPTSPLGRDLVGEVDVYVAKDRHGYVRSRAAGVYGKDRLQLVAKVTVDGTAGALRVLLDAPPRHSTPDERREEMRGRVMAFLAEWPEGEPGASTNTVKRDVKGDPTDIIAALDSLVRDGYVGRTAKGQSRLHRLVKPYVPEFAEVSE